MAGVGDALLGAAISELFSLVKTAIKKHKDLPILLLQIQSTLESLQPLMQDMEKLNRYLRRPTEEIQSLKRQVDEGIECVREIFKSKKFKSTWSHHDKLVKLDRSLNRLYNILNAHSARNGMEILLCTQAIFVLVLLLLIILGVLSFLLWSNGVIVRLAKDIPKFSGTILQSEDKPEANVGESLKMEQSFTLSKIKEISLTPVRPTQEESNTGFEAAQQNSSESFAHFHDDNQEAIPDVPIASNDIVHLQKLVRDLTATFDDLVGENSRLKRKVSDFTKSLNNSAAARGDFITASNAILSSLVMFSKAWSNVTLGTAVRALAKVLVYAAYAFNIFCFLAIGGRILEIFVHREGSCCSWMFVFYSLFIVLPYLKFWWRLIGLINQEL